MRTLPSSSSKIIFDKLVVPPKESPLLRPETCSLLPSRKVDSFGLLHLISVRHKAAHPVVTSLSSKTQADLETVHTRSQETCQSKTVHVRFQLQKQCMFGEQFLVVGDDPMFGLWDPASAIPLNWSDGHRWTVDLDMPAAKAVNFKFILKEITGNIVWQPGPDRTFQTWETENTVTVCEDWDNAEFQKIIEEGQLADPNEYSIVDSEMIIVSENFGHPKEVVSHVNQGSAIPYSNTVPCQKPITEPHKEKIIADNIALPQEKPKAIVADNISYSNENPKVTANSKMFGAIVSDPKEESTAIPNEVAIIAEELLGNNFRVLTVENPGSTHIEGNLINHGGPVLVPGLTPFSKVPTEETSKDESEKTIAFDVSFGAYEAKDDIEPELAKKEETDAEAPQPAPSKIFNDEEEKFEREFEQKLHLPEREEQSYSGQIDNDVLQNDIQWGRKTLLKFLTNLGLL